MSIAALQAGDAEQSRTALGAQIAQVFALGPIKARQLPAMQMGGYGLSGDGQTELRA
ncbi:MAG: hypothetical protein ACM3ML_08530 [Micromonosporaceae bacterium]